MAGKKSWLAAALFVASIFIVVYKIANPARIEISVGTSGQVVVTEIPQVYGLVDIVAVAAFAIVAGVAGQYLLRAEADVRGSLAPDLRAGQPAESGPPSTGTDATALVSRLLDGEPRKVYLTVLKHRGEILQRELVLETQMPKATLSRALSSLSNKGLISRSPYGLTNKIVAIRTLEELNTR